MSAQVGYDQLAAMLRAAAEQVRANHKTLSRLDSHGGDGDHGTTMSRAMGLVEKAIADSESRQLKSLLFDAGWAVMGVDGGATGPLLGTLLMGMAEAVGDKEALDAQDLAATFEAGLAAVQKRTRAQVGDKTLLDALVPAVEALRQYDHCGDDVAAALQQAAEAAHQGARATTELQARFGRAKNLGEKSKGHQDPGATSMALIFRGFAEGFGSSPS
ncbi:MAG: dihydroxyacetone kinase subunit DhaL [Candidatus Brocadiia bacterium]